MLWKTLLQSFRGLIHSIQIIFHQFVGLFFLMLGLSAAYASLREYKSISAEDTSTAWRFYLTVGFAVLLLVFATGAFLRARGIRKKSE